MKTNTLFGLAFLNYNWESSKKDILDAYIPLICECISQMSMNPVNRDALKAAFLQIYGIDIPLGALETMLKRCATKKILKKNQGEYIPNQGELIKHIKASNKGDIAYNYDQIVENIIRYAEKKFKTKFDTEDIEKGLLTFLDDYDTDIVLSADNITEDYFAVKEGKKIKYIISKYVIYAKDHKKTDFKKLLDIAKGHSIASLITYTNIDAYVGQLGQVDIYLDAPIIFNLMGVNGEANHALSTELISQLRDKGANIKVFEVNYEEVISTVNDAIDRLTTGDYNLSISSRILRTAVRESYTPSRLKIKLEQLPQLFEKHTISVVEAPIFNGKYSIDEAKLTKCIETLYLQGKKQKILFPHQKESIERDVQTISHIYQLRKSQSPQSLKQSKAILLSSNQAISYCSKNQAISKYGHNSKIAPCETDLFISTILWANYPSKNGDIKMKQLMAICYDNIELDDRIFQRFYSEVKKLHEEHTITDEQFYLLNASNLTSKLLKERTLNDINDYTDKTPQEIVDDIINSLQHEGKVMVSNVDSISKSLGKIIFWFIWVALFAIIFFVNKLLPKFNITSCLWNWIITIGAGLLGGFGLFRWIGIIPSKSSIVDFFANKIKKGILKFLQKE